MSWLLWPLQVLFILVQKQLSIPLQDGVTMAALRPSQSFSTASFLFITTKDSKK